MRSPDVPNTAIVIVTYISGGYSGKLGTIIFCLQKKYIFYSIIEGAYNILKYKSLVWHA